MYFSPRRSHGPRRYRVLPRESSTDHHLHLVLLYKVDGRRPTTSIQVQPYSHYVSTTVAVHDITVHVHFHSLVRLVNSPPPRPARIQEVISIFFCSPSLPSFPALSSLISPLESIASLSSAGRASLPLPLRTPHYTGPGVHTRKSVNLTLLHVM